MNADRILGLREEEARLLCERYNISLVISGEDNEFYFVIPNGWDSPARIVAYIADGIIEEAHYG